MTTPVRVLYVVSDLLEGRGGIQSVVMSIFEHIDRSRVQIDFVIHQDYAPSFVPFVKEKGSRVYAAPQFKKEGPFAYIRWWNRFFKEHPGYKVVHGHMKAYISLYLLIAKLHGCVTIAHSHSAYPQLSFFKKYSEKLALYPLRWIADYHFACSLQAGECLYGKNIVKKPSFRFIPNARDTKVFLYDEEKRKMMRKKLNLTDNFVIGHSGRFDEQKNHVFLIKIFEEIYRRNPQARLLLLGTGKLKEQIEQQIAKLGLEKAVLFTGVVPNPQDYYQAMDVFLLPSLSEGLPLVLVEAQMVGLPCIMSSHLPSDVDFGCGLLQTLSLKQSASQWADRVLNLDRTTRKSYAKEAAEKGFEIRTLAKQLEDFYLQVKK